MLQTLEQHYDRWLGAPADAWSVEDIAVSVALFKNVPERGLHTFATIGLGAHELNLGKQKLRQELLLTCRAEYASWPLQKHLFGAANVAIDSHRAYHRGDAIDIGGVNPELPNCGLTGFAFSDPVRFCDDFMVLRTLQPPLMVVEMLAITRAEHQQIEQHGIDWLLDRCSDGKIDELDFLRR
jgi:hypothetical protein